MIIESKQLAKPPEIVGKLEDKDVYEYVTKGGYYVVVAKGDKCEPETLGVGPHRLIARSVAKKKLKEMKKEISFSDLHKSEELPESVLQKYLPDWENVLEILYKNDQEDYAKLLSQFEKEPTASTFHKIIPYTKNEDEIANILAKHPSPELYLDLLYYSGRTNKYAINVYRDISLKQLIERQDFYQTSDVGLYEKILGKTEQTTQQKLKKYTEVNNILNEIKKTNPNFKNDNADFAIGKIFEELDKNELSDNDLNSIRTKDLVNHLYNKDGPSDEFKAKIKNKINEKIGQLSPIDIIDCFKGVSSFLDEHKNIIENAIKRLDKNQVDSLLSNDSNNYNEFIYRTLKKTKEISLSEYLGNPTDERANLVVGTVHVPVIQNGNSHKLRIARDTILASGKQELHPKLLPPGNWAEFRLPNGNISADLIQKKIDASRVPYEYRFSTWSGAQRHSDQDSNVLQIHATPEMIKQVEDAGLKHLFDEFYRTSSGWHPVSNGTSIGWVRWTGNQKGIQIDEIQTDISAKRFNKEKDAEKIEKTKQLQKILFQGKHPSELMHEAFLQSIRDVGWHDTPVHIHDIEAKVNLSGLDPQKEPPAHFKEGYRDIPKKMGYQPAQYGTLETQQNPSKEMQGSNKTQHAEKIRKFEYLDILKPFMKAQK